MKTIKQILQFHTAYTMWIKAFLACPDVRDLEPSALIAITNELNNAFQDKPVHADNKEKVECYMKQIKDVKYSLDDYDVALSPLRHTQMPRFDEIRRMSDAQLLLDAVLAKRLIRVIDIKIELELRKERKQDEGMILWFKTNNNLEQALLEDDPKLHDHLANLLHDHDDFEEWFHARWNQIAVELNEKQHAGILDKAIRAAERIVSGSSS